MKKNFIFAIVLTAFFTPAVHAASVSATVDWSRFEVEFLGGSGSYWTDYEQGEALAVVADSLSNYYSSGSEHAASSVWQGLIASANVDGPFFASSVAHYGPVGSVSNLAYATSALSGVANLNAGTIALFSVPFHLSASVMSAGVEDTAGYVGLFACSVMNPNCSLQEAELLLDNISLGSATSEKMGILEFQIANTTSDLISINWGVIARAQAFTSVTAVPEPGTFALLFFGLCLAVGATRFRVRTTV